MPTYAIGDIQGCFSTLQRLLTRIGFDPARDRLWLAGDLVNRGPRSLEVLRWAAAHERALVSVLGNHDLHLLGAAAGLRPPKPKDTLEQVLSAPDADPLLAWLRQRPLLHRDGDWALVHAGLHPDWTLADAERLARAIEGELRGAGWRDLLAALYGGGSGELEQALRVFTLMRVVRADGALDLEFNGPPAERPEGTTPWFELPSRRPPGTRVVFGHWAALGLHVTPSAVGLDTGCVWGKTLTAFRLEDGAIAQERRVD